MIERVKHELCLGDSRLFISGPHASGKTALAETSKKYGFDYIDVGPTLRRIHLDESPQGIPFEEWRKEGELRVGQHFMDSLLLERLKEFMRRVGDVEDVFVIGYRSLKGILFIEQNLKFGPKNLIVYIEAPINTLKERYCSREEIDITERDFRDLLRKDKEIGVEEIKDSADYVIFNNGNIASLEMRFLEILKENGYRLKERDRKCKELPS